MSDELSEDEIAQITASLYAGQKLHAIKIYCDATGKGLKEAKEFIDTIEKRLRAESPGQFIMTRGSCGTRMLFAFLIVGIYGGLLVYWTMAANKPAAAPPAPLAPKVVVNVSDPATPIDMEQEQGPHSKLNLSGMWRLSLPAGFQHPTELKLIDDGRFEFRSKGVMNGEYVVRGNRLVMDKPNDKQQVNLWKFRWRIIDADHLELIGQPNPRTYGGQYLGATLERVKR